MSSVSGGDSGVLVTAAGEYSALDRERAETYLRLQAEAELRRVLAMPEYKRPRDRRTASALFWTGPARRMRRRRASVDRIMQLKAVGPGQVGQQAARGPANAPEPQPSSLLALRRISAWWVAKVQLVISPPAQRLWQTVNNRRYRVSHQIRMASWGLRAHFTARFARGGYEQSPAHARAERVGELAAVLAAVGAISAQTEADVVADFTFALAARGRIEPDALLADHGFPSHWMRQQASTHPPPAGPPRAYPVGVFANGEVEGVPIRFYFGVLVFDQGSVTVTIQAKFPPESFEHDHRHSDPMFDALSDIRAVDDRGGTYSADFSGGGGGGNCDGRLHLTPAPPAGLRWLDVTLPGASVVRIPMDNPPSDLRVATEAVTTTRADRFLDAQTAAHLLLVSAKDAGVLLSSEDTSSLVGMAADLLAAGVVSTSSESMRRLAGAAAHLGVRLRGSLATIEPAGVPADWLTLHARADREDGPVGIIAAAAVLPVVDGAQCVIGELVSDADSATMQVHARGWPESRHHGGLRVDPFEWTARDDLGGWYVLGYRGGSSGGDEADLDYEFSPALDSRARSLDIILTGATSRVTVTVPLDWQELA